jgi:hypothetical protein
MHVSTSYSIAYLLSILHDSLFPLSNLISYTVVGYVDTS